MCISKKKLRRPTSRYLKIHRSPNPWPVQMRPLNRSWNDLKSPKSTIMTWMKSAMYHSINRRQKRTDLQVEYLYNIICIVKYCIMSEYFVLCVQECYIIHMCMWTYSTSPRLPQSRALVPTPLEGVEGLYTVGSCCQVNPFQDKKKLFTIQIWLIQFRKINCISKYWHSKY